jgi:hypothetical protein
MAGWRLWAASAIGATAAGAGLALRRRRRPETAPAALSAPPPPPPPPPAPLEEEDPQAALDAARDRLRDRADALRREIESAGDGAPGGE